MDASTPQEPQYWTAWFLRAMCYCCVNSFALATGYLMVDKTFRFGKLINMWLIVVFYLAVLAVIGSVIIPGSIGITKIFSICFPVTSHSYWYFTSYFILFLFGNFINKAIEHTQKEQYKIVLISGFVFFSLSHVLNIVYIDPFNMEEGFSPWWIIYLYLLGAGIKKFHYFEKMSIKNCIYGYWLSVFLTWGSKLIIHIVSTFNISILSLFCHKYGEDRFISYLSPTVVFSAIFLTILCIKIKIPKFMKNILVRISPLIFQVYIIHMHFWVAENIIRDKFGFVVDYSPIIMIIIIIALSVGIFTACIFIDNIRYYIFNMIGINKMIDFLQTKFSLVKKSDNRN